MERKREAELERGERGVISVMFVDIARSTEHVADMTPDEAQDFLDGALDLMIENLHVHGGFVVKTLGDGVMAVFGAPVPSEEHALRACLAGIAIRDAFLRDGRHPAQIRVGIHSGPAVIKWRDNDSGRELNSVGSTVHIAKRIEEMSPVGSIATSATTTELASASMQTRRLGVIQPRDRNGGEVVVLELIDIHPDDNVDKRFIGRAPNQLVGRQSEMKLVAELIGAVHERRSSAMALVAEAGMGKSRIAYEASVRCVRANIACETLRGLAVNSDTPFSTLRPLIARLLGRDEVVNADALVVRLRAWGLTEVEALGVMALLNNGALENDLWRSLATHERQRAIVDGAAKVLTAHTAVAPLLLIVEDLHFIDRETASFLRSLKTQVEEHKVGLLVTARPEFGEEARALCGNVVDLGPLEPEHAQRLANIELSASTPDQRTAGRARLVDAIVARAGGSPLAVEEFSRMALSAPSPELFQAQTLPVGLENVFDSRLGALSVEARTIVQAASVLGGQSELQMLRRIAGLDEVEFDRGLARLLDHRVLEIADVASARLSHQLMQEACYAGIPRTHRQQLHRTAYDVLKSSADLHHCTDQELARHALAAGDRSTALQHLSKAILQAISNAAIHSVAALYRKAKAICDDIGADAAIEGATLTILVFGAFHLLGEQEELIAALEEAKTTMARIGGARGAVEADIHLAMAHWISGRYREGLECAKRASGQVAPEDVPLAAYSAFALANLEFANGAPRAAVARLRQLIVLLSDELEMTRFSALINGPGAMAPGPLIMARARPDGAGRSYLRTMMRVPGAMALAFASWYLADVGEFEEARLCVDGVTRIADELDHEYTRLLACIARGLLALRTGNANEAATDFEEARRICLAGDYCGLEPSVSAWCAEALLAIGRVGRAQTVLAESFALGNHEKIRNVARYLLYASKAQLCVRLGDLDDALAVIEQAIGIAEANGDPVHRAHGLFERALIRLLRDEGEAAEADLVECCADAKRMGLAPLASLSEAKLLTLSSLPHRG
jgi:class 3 adenylate cyclase/tetratricopeptide (TPR) repeat protein